MTKRKQQKQISISNFFGPKDRKLNKNDDSKENIPRNFKSPPKKTIEASNNVPEETASKIHVVKKSTISQPLQSLDPEITPDSSDHGIRREGEEVNVLHPEETPKPATIIDNSSHVSPSSKICDGVVENHTQYAIEKPNVNIVPSENDLILKVKKKHKISQNDEDTILNKPGDDSNSQQKKKKQTQEKPEKIEARPMDPKVTKLQQQLKMVLEASKCEDEMRPDRLLQTERPVSEIFAELEEGMTSSQIVDKLAPIMSTIVQGSTKPLTEVSAQALEYLQAEAQKFLDRELVLEQGVLAEKINIIAERKSYGIAQKGVVITEDLTEEALWHWETTLLDIFDKASQAIIKEIRTERRRNGLYLKSIEKLLMVLRKSPNDEVKISEQEEKVAKFARQVEMARMKAEQKRLREETLAAKARAKQEEAAAKARAREEDRQRREREKEQREKEREEERRLKAELREQEKEERERKREQELQVKQEKEMKDKMKMSVLNFFSPQFKRSKTKLDRPDGQEDDVTNKSANPSTSGPNTSQVQACLAVSAFDQGKFDAALKSNLPLNELLTLVSSSKVLKRKERATKRPLFKTITVSCSRTAADDPFGPSFVELVDRRFRNKMKHLEFHEDVRPPYFGTFSRASTEVGPRHPFHKDDKIDYEYDSEAEWEEGDDAEGESIDGSDGEDEEPATADALDYDDGWLRHEDDMGSDREGEEEVGLAQVTLEKRQAAKGVSAGQVIGPYFRLPSEESCPPPELEPYLIVRLLDGEGPLIVDPPGHEEPEVVHAKDDGQSSGTNQPAESRLKVLDDEMLKALVQILKGKAIKREDAIETFCSRFSRPSKKLVNLTISEIGVRERRQSDGLLVWFIDRALLKRLGLDAGSPYAIYRALPQSLMLELVQDLRGRHHTTSLDKLATEFSDRHQFLIRKVVRRTIQEIATKKNPNPEESDSAMVWEVKKEVLDELGLEDDASANKPELDPLPWQKPISGFFSMQKGPSKLQAPITPGRCSDGGWEEMKMSEPVTTLDIIDENSALAQQLRNATKAKINFTSQDHSAESQAKTANGFKGLFKSSCPNKNVHEKGNDSRTKKLLHPRTPEIESKKEPESSNDQRSEHAAKKMKLGKSGEEI